jgi:2-amino-4-hydroxy-6-hydroxymethyldihydropteridine diphosphokinase
MSRRALLLLGGNVGDRLGRLRGAVAALAKLPGGRVRARSRVYETAPVGPSKRPYLNAVVALDTALSPMGLLVECKRLEDAAGRRRGGRWTARPLDVDILFLEGVRLKSPWLAIPHPLIYQRPFVLAPLRDAAPRLVPRSFSVPAGSVKLYPHGL